MSKAARTVLYAIAILGLVAGSEACAQRAVAVPAPVKDAAPGPGLQTAVLAGGCFWGIEAVFEQMKGVRSATAGYAGGSREDATYERVSSERTGHAEAVRIVYDPRVVSYGTLLRVYFSVAHDPTQVGGQGPDRGPSYRSAIFPQNPEQRAVAAAYIAQLSQAHAFSRPITTRLENGAFYPAEGYHQGYFRQHPNSAYIVANDKPKVAALHAVFPKLTN